MKLPATHQRLAVCVGKAGTLVGELAYAQLGQRDFSRFAYGARWRASQERFEVSPDLPGTGDHRSG